MNKVTKESIEAKIKKIEYKNLSGKGTNCLITMQNGFEAAGISFCQRDEDYDQGIGEESAYKQAMEILWAVEIYLMNEDAYRKKDRDKSEFDNLFIRGQYKAALHLLTDNESIIKLFNKPECEKILETARHWNAEMSKAKSMTKEQESALKVLDQIAEKISSYCMDMDSHYTMLFGKDFKEEVEKEFQAVRDERTMLGEEDFKKQYPMTPDQAFKTMSAVNNKEPYGKRQERLCEAFTVPDFLTNSKHMDLMKKGIFIQNAQEGLPLDNWVHCCKIKVVTERNGAVVNQHLIGVNPTYNKETSCITIDIRDKEVRQELFKALFPVATDAAFNNLESNDSAISEKERGKRPVTIYEECGPFPEIDMNALVKRVATLPEVEKNVLKTWIEQNWLDEEEEPGIFIEDFFPTDEKGERKFAVYPMTNDGETMNQYQNGFVSKRQMFQFMFPDAPEITFTNLEKFVLMPEMSEKKGSARAFIELFPWASQEQFDELWDNRNPVTNGKKIDNDQRLIDSLVKIVHEGRFTFKSVESERIITIIKGQDVMNAYGEPFITGWLDLADNPQLRVLAPPISDKPQVEREDRIEEFKKLFPAATENDFKKLENRQVVTDELSFMEKAETLEIEALQGAMPENDKQIRYNKIIRQELEIIAKALAGSSRKNSDRSTAIRKIKEGRMWLGQDLNDLGDKNPYPEGNNPENTIVEPIAKELRL